MPAAIMMENGAQQASRTDHDREIKMNGINGTHADASSKATPDSNGPAKDGQITLAHRTRWNDLPDEIGHITENFISLSKFLTRLSQRSHNSLQHQVLELSKMPLSTKDKGDPTGIKKPDGKILEDERDPAQDKKVALLRWAQELHTKWIKALVITEWSRKVDQVSKVIDLNAHLHQHLELYNSSFNDMINVKRDLTFARIPSPDLKTALHILSTGEAPWLSDQNYIEPPPLTASEQAKWLTDVDTLISLRLNLDDFDKVPTRFRDYSIDSGRVTFKVEGEFELDLTIADEDFEKQFWFIDFRFGFKPAAQTLSDNMRKFLDLYANDSLSRGLGDCYQFLHEFVLTAKINELRRQAFRLSRGVWTGQLMIEPLKRALSIQYWTERSQANGTKSWVLVAVNSGQKKGAKEDDKANAKSHLCIKWYRDNKEITDAVIPFDSSNLSTEQLLKTIVGRHVEHLLRSIHDALKETARFQKREAAMTLHISESNPETSSLKVQVGHATWVTLMVELATGLFALKPHSRFSAPYEHRLNGGNNPIEDGARCLEQIRCAITEDEISRQGSPMGWVIKPTPLSIEEVRLMPKARDASRTIWLRRNGWPRAWFVAIFLSLRGDEWWLLETSTPRPRMQRFQAHLPLRGGHPLSTEFWQSLFMLTTGIMAQTVDRRELHIQGIRNKPIKSLNPSSSIQIRMPTIQISLSSIFPAMVTDMPESHTDYAMAKTLGISGKSELASMLQPQSLLALASKQSWANDLVSIKFKGVRAAWKNASDTEEVTGAESDGQPLVCVSDAIIIVSKPAKLASLKGLVDDDVSYHPRRGEFCVRMNHVLGKSMLDILKSRIKAIDRFVNYHEALEKMGDRITCKSATLRTVVCSYGDAIPTADAGAKSPERQWPVTLDLSKQDINVRLGMGNPHLRSLDLIQRLVNVDGGIKALLTWLPQSLPLLNTIDSIAAGWDDLTTKDQGRVDFCMRTIDWMSLRYTIRAVDSRGKKVDKVLKLEARIKMRKREMWWHIWREARPTSSPPDKFDAALQPILHGKGNNWQGLANSASGSLEDGVVRMLQSLDDSVKALVGQMDGDEPQVKKEAQTQAQARFQPQPQAQAPQQPPSAQAQPQKQLQPAATIHPQNKGKGANRGGKQGQKGNRPQGGSAQTAVVIE